MAVRTITTKLALTGEKEYKAAIQNINAEYRLYQSQLEKVEALYKGQSNSLDALTAKEAALSGQSDALSRKYAQQSTMLEKAQQMQRLYTYEVEQSSEKLNRAKAKLEELSNTDSVSATIRKKLTEEVKNHSKALELSEQNLQKAVNSIVSYQKSLNNTERDQANLNTALQETRKYLEEARSSSDKTAHSIDAFGQKIGSAGNSMEASVKTMASALSAAGVARGVQEITEAIKACADASIQFQSDITGVFKTVDGTEAQLAEIRDGILEMSTQIPATTTAISEVAESAGHLGIARENVLDFTRTMIDLGESSDLIAQAAATSLARFANVTKMQPQYYSNLGSAIVGLGNNFATAESEVVNMGLRLASAGTLAKLTQPEILALAAAMSSVGIEAEAGGTAMTQTLTAIEKAVTSGGDKLEQFAQISGMSAATFAMTWKTDAITAIQAFISGLGQLDEAGESATLVLDDLGLSGVRQSNMLKSLALASDQLTGAVQLANQAWEENTSLAEKAEKRYATTESKLAMLDNAANNAKIAIGDALLPALGELAEAGTSGFSWAAEFIEENPWLVQALTGVTAALAVYTAGIAGYTAVTKLAELAQKKLNLTMLLNPYVAVAAAITGLVVALGAYAASQEIAEDSTRGLIESLEETADAYDETRNALRQDSEDVASTIAALERLAAVENKSAAQKAALGQMVEELNAKLPDLTLSYDAQRDRLVDLSTGAEMATASIRALAEAEAERQSRAADIQRLTELLQEQKQIEAELATSKDRLEAAQAELNEQLLAGNPATAGLEMSVHSLQTAYNDLTAAQADNAAAIAEIELRYDDAGETAVETVEELETVKKVTIDLTAALKEQAAQGEISQKTARALEEAGYATALAVDEETGAVTLNTQKYVQLATAKLNDQIASLETQRQSIQNRIEMAEEAREASRLGSAYWDAAISKAAMDQRDLSALNAQISALTETRQQLQAYAADATRAAGASKKAQTQAEQDLAAYKELQAELNHQKNLELVSERDYYLKLKEYRDQYLTDQGNVDEYRRITEQIFKFDKALVDEEAALWAKQTQTLVESLEDRVEAIASSQSRMQDKLSGYGDLFTVKDEKMTLENLQKQVDAINDYEAALEHLRERGIADSLMNEVLGMDVDSATQYAQQLLSMSEEQLEKYNDLWEEKQQRALEVSEKFFKDQLAALEEEYTVKLGEALDTMTDTSFTSGENTAQGLIDGLASKESALYAKAQAMAEEVEKIFSSVKIPSNAEIAATLDMDRLREPAPVTAQDVRRVGTAVVDGIGVAAERPLYVTVQSTMKVNGKEFFTETLQDQRAVARANPEVMDDK